MSQWFPGRMDGRGWMGVDGCVRIGFRACFKSLHTARASSQQVAEHPTNHPQRKPRPEPPPTQPTEPPPQRRTLNPSLVMGLNILKQSSKDAEGSP